MIASRAMQPAYAVMVVAFFEFLGPLLGGTAVANTIGKFIDLNGLKPRLALGILLCGMLGAITWNLITWWKGIPSSSSHALVGGLAGAVIISVGPGHVAWGFSELLHGNVTGVTKVLLALLLSPLLGFWVAFLVHKIMTRLLAGASALRKGFSQLGKHTAAASDDAETARKAERAIDYMYRDALAALFQGDDYIQMFKRREIYRHVTNAAERMAHCASTLHDIVVKMV